MHYSLLYVILSIVNQIEKERVIMIKVKVLGIKGKSFTDFIRVVVFGSRAERTFLEHFILLAGHDTRAIALDGLLNSDFINLIKDDDTCTEFSMTCAYLDEFTDSLRSRKVHIIYEN